jgi:hypothetical protein
VHCVVCHEQFASDGVARLHWTKAGHVHPSTVTRLRGCEERHGLVWRRADGAGWEGSDSSAGPVFRDDVPRSPAPARHD